MSPAIVKTLAPFFLFAAALVAADPAPKQPRVRPAEWAAPLIATSLGNAYRVSDDLFRCEQPGAGDIPDLQTLHVKSLLNLREYHTDSAKFEQAGFTLLLERMDAGTVTVDQLVAALRKFRAAPKPVVVHCWHGSDRTGTFVATYRMVVQGWTRAAAIDEFRHGGFGYHEKTFPNLLTLLNTLDIEAVRRRVNE